MGTDAADYDGNGWMDLYVTHLNFELDRLYRNNGDGTFDDATDRSQIGSQIILFSGFGTRFFDYDNDGRVDLFVANGHILDNIHLFHDNVTYAEPNLMFRNMGEGRFDNVSDQLGPEFSLPRVSRGAALGDYDNDGGDAFSATGVIQVPTDQLRTGSSNTPKDNQNITVDTGGFFGKGVTLPSLNSGGTLRPITTVDLLYVAADSDNPQNFSMNIFLATTSGLKVDNLIRFGQMPQLLR